MNLSLRNHKVFMKKNRENTVNLWSEFKESAFFNHINIITIWGFLGGVNNSHFCE